MHAYVLSSYSRSAFHGNRIRNKAFSTASLSGTCDRGNAVQLEFYCDVCNMQIKLVIKGSIAVTRTATGGILYLNFHNLLEEPLSWLIFHNIIMKMLLILMVCIAPKVLEWYYIAYGLVMHWWECSMKNVLTHAFIVLFCGVSN